MPRGIPRPGGGFAWTRVSSTNIRAVAHTGAPSNVLYVEFKSGKIAHYDAVPREVFRRMLNSASKGKFLWRVIRNNGADDLYSWGYS